MPSGVYLRKRRRRPPHTPPTIISTFSKIVNYDLPRWTDYGPSGDLWDEKYRIHPKHFPNPYRGEHKVHFGWLLYQRMPSSRRVLRDSQREQRRSPVLAEAVTVLEGLSTDERLELTYVALCSKKVRDGDRFPRIHALIADEDEIRLETRLLGPWWSAVKVRHLVVLP